MNKKFTLTPEQYDRLILVHKSLVKKSEKSQPINCTDEIHILSAIIEKIQEADLASPV